MTHKKECKALEVGFHSACDCGEFDKTKQELEGDYHSTIERSIIFRIIISSFDRQGFALESEVREALRAHLALYYLRDEIFNNPNDKRPSPSIGRRGNQVINDKTLLTWAVVDNLKESTIEYAEMTIENLQRMKTCLEWLNSEVTRNNLLIEHIDKRIDQLADGASLNNI